MRHFPATPREIGASLWRNRSLIFTLTKREILGRYKGSFIGLLWSFLNPILMLTIYTFVFSVVFKARWGNGGDSKVEFALLLFIGLIVFNIFSECITRAPGIILNNQNYVKKVIFPLEILPWVTMGSALFHGLASLCVWLIAYIIFYGAPHPTIFLLPLVISPLIIFVMGLNWLLTALGVYFRDAGQLTSFITTALLFMSPIFYPITAMPEPYRLLVYINPLTSIIEQSREILFWGKTPDFIMLSCYALMAGVTAWLGFATFQKTRKGFADVL